MKSDYQKLIQELGPGRVLLKEPMSRHTCFRLGGPADLFYVAENKDELAGAVKAAERCQTEWFILGGGSNILVGDLGIRGLVIKNMAAKISHKRQYLIAESGALLNRTVAYANNEGLAGLANYFTIPGTVGGAIFNNSHGWPNRNELIGNLVYRAEILDKGIQRMVEASWFEFAYEDSKLQHHPAVLLEVILKLKRGDRLELKKISAEILKARSQKQPVGACCSGCVFANPENEVAGRLIEAVGLKGRRIGGAEVSGVHANFIVNLGDAIIAEVLELMALMKNKVKERFGIELKPEIFLIGEFSYLPEGLEKYGTLRD